MFRSLLFSLSAALLLASCDNGTGQTSTSPVAPSPQSQQILEDTDTTVTLSAGGVVKFQFFPTSGQAYLIKTYGNTDILLELRDSTKEQILKTDSFPTSINGSLAFQATSNSPVWIHVRGKYSYTEGSTTLSVSSMSEVDKYEPDSSMATAQWITTDGKYQRHYLQSKEVDWVKFHADSGKAYQLKISTAIKTRFSVYIDSSDPKLVTNKYDYATFKISKSGSVFVSIVNDNTFGVSKGGSYLIAVTVDTTSPDRFEPDSTRATAHTITANNTPQALTLLAGDVDWSKFHADSGKTYLVRKSGDFHGIIRIFPDSLASAEASYSYSSALLKATKTGNMFISFMGFDTNSAGHYALTVSVDTTADDAYENNDTKQRAQPITVDAPAQQHILVSRDIDWVKFYGEAGKTYTFKATTKDSYSIFGNFEGGSRTQMQSAEFTSNEPWSFEITPEVSGFLYTWMVLPERSSTKRTYTVQVLTKN